MVQHVTATLRRVTAEYEIQSNFIICYGCCDAKNRKNGKLYNIISAFNIHIVWYKNVFKRD